MAAFLKGKTLAVISTADWKDGAGDKAKVIGTKVETVITRDDTDYGAEGVTNLYEKIIVKLAKTGFSVPAGSQVELVNAVGTVYGDYSQNLSVKADDIRVINQGGK